MKKILLLSTLFLIILVSCSGSDTYQGNWKAMDPDGNKFEISFSSDSFSITDNTGKITKYAYTQHSIKTENSVETYGIKLEDGRGTRFIFR
jgi:ABC-type phosphate/phosphonate transport system substrate-binding protein